MKGLVFLHVVLALTCRPDGRHVAVSSLNAHITFWDVER